MPITQDRLMTIVTAAAALVETFRELRQTNKQYTTTAISQAATLIEAEIDETIKTALRDLIAVVHRFYEIIDQNDILATDLTLAVMAEQMHFKRNAKQNALAAQKQRLARQQQGIVPRQQYETNSIKATATIMPIKPAAHIAVASNEDAERSYLAWQLMQERKNLTIADRQRLRQEAIARGETQAEVFAERTQPTDAWPKNENFDPVPIDVEANAEAAAAAAAMAKAVADANAQISLLEKADAIRAKQAKARGVIYSSAPTATELKEPDFKPGEKLF